ncbi:hypothetical protein Taro_021816 [Colocasia esculenta]|uniref:Ubiquitin-like protease family profile domain-containing protein n=1 Tax=Colocasia esculenta TaxID=4460 RepID=A0A843V033_COLES|nr:hypothetical protein [Colocasia esculenta]
MGIPHHSSPINLKADGTKASLRRILGSKQKMDRHNVLRKLTEYVPQEGELAVEISVKLWFALLCSCFFFPTSGRSELLSILAYLDDLHEMKSVNWATAIHEYLISAMRQCHEHVKAAGRPIKGLATIDDIHVHHFRNPPSDKHVLGILQELLRVSKQWREVMELQSGLLHLSPTATGAPYSFSTITRRSKDKYPTPRKEAGEAEKKRNEEEHKRKEVEEQKRKRNEEDEEKRKEEEEEKKRKEAEAEKNRKRHHISPSSLSRRVAAGMRKRRQPEIYTVCDLMFGGTLEGYDNFLSFKDIWDLLFVGQSESVITDCYVNTCLFLPRQENPQIFKTFGYLGVALKGYVQSCKDDKSKQQHFDYSFKTLDCAPTELELLFSPMHVGTNHWALLVINIKEKEFHVYDSLRNKDRLDIPKYVEELRRYMKDKHIDAENWLLRYPDPCPQ